MQAVSVREVLVDQFDLVWALTELHLAALSEDDFPWRPSDLVWTVRQDADGAWRPDWADVEPDPIPVPTVAWLTWQMLWYWTTALARLEQRDPPDRHDVTWPGTGMAAIDALRDLSTRWRAALVALDDEGLARPSAFPWPADAGRTVAHMVAWLNVELAKNAAEIGQIRMIRATTR